MSATAKKIAKPATRDSYLALILLHPLKAIKSQADYDAASMVLDGLALREDLDTGQEEYLDALEVLITAYDDKCAPETADGRSPLQKLKALMDASGTSPAQLRTILGSGQPMVSMVLNGQRELSKKAIGRLAAHFKVEPGYFL